MNTNIRRFAAALSLTVALAAMTPTATAAPREREIRTREPKVIVIIKKLFGITTLSDTLTIPIPH